jgi:zinc protease
MKSIVHGWAWKPAVALAALLGIAAMAAGVMPRGAKAGPADIPAPGAPGAVKIPPLAIMDVKLPNGLRVLIAADHRAPVFGIRVTYNVGSRNERPGRTGFAHLFEHMMFEGSANVGKGEHDILIERNGGQDNASTNEDSTFYFERLPKNQLDLALFLESDRMRALDVTQANLDNQRNAVQEERRLRIDNQPYGHTELDVDNLAYDNFAYKHSTIGSMDDLNHAALGDFQDFFRTYYAPNNAVLSIVGDLDPDATLESVKKYFASIPEQPIPPKPDLTEPPHYGERTDTIYDPLARLPLLYIAYHVPPGDTPGNFAAQLLGDVLGTGRSSLLYQHLVDDKQLATEVDVSVDMRIGTGQFYIDAIPRAGVKIEDLQKALDGEIDAVVRNGVTQAQLDKAQAQELQTLVRQRASSLATAIYMGRYAVYFNDPNLINTAPEKYQAVTVADISQAAKTIFQRDQRTVVITLPTAASGGDSAPAGN